MGRPWPPKHGYPVRVVSPSRYFYKSLKWLKEIVFLSEDQLGFWERASGYHNVGDPWLEQRLEGHRFTSQAEVARFRNLTDFSAYRTNSPESVIVCKRRVKTGTVEAPGENRYTHPTHPSEQHEPARSE